MGIMPPEIDNILDKPQALAPARPDRVKSSARFWPYRNRHAVASIRLADPSVGNLTVEAIAALREAAQLAEIVRGAEALDPRVETGELADVALAKSAHMLERAARTLTCADSAMSLRLRAKMLRSGQDRKIQTQLVSLDEQQLVSLCGPLGTWHGKSKNTYHSALFAAVDRDLNQTINRLSRGRLATQQFIQDLIDPRLILGEPPRIKFAQLIFCGGEANLYPKHFAYFMPEDEGIKHARHKKTLVLSNVYSEMYRQVSEPFSRHIIAATKKPEHSAIEQHLCMWFYGHDNGHEVRLPQTDYSKMRGEGRWLSMVLQEAMADVFGFLMCTSEPWTRRVPSASAELATDIFLREMLRYLCRGGDDFPDAGAALIELSFLRQNGFVDIDSSTPSLKTNPQRLLDGMTALAGLFCATALSNELRGMQNLLAKYYHHDNITRQFVASCGVCDVVLDYLQDIA